MTKKEKKRRNLCRNEKGRVSSFLSILLILVLLITANGPAVLAQTVSDAGITKLDAEMMVSENAVTDAETEIPQAVESQLQVTDISAERDSGSMSLSNPVISNGITTWDCVWFGNYPQSDATGATSEPVKWRVLQVSGNQLLLLADQNLDVQKYNDNLMGVTWETCTMRNWLNTTFLDKAFTTSQQAAIPTTTVVNADNSEYGIEGGSDTQDQIFLLSETESMVPAYGFTSTKNETNTREAQNTAYVASGGTTGVAGMSSAGCSSVWWLRSPGSDTVSAAFVSHDGFLDRYGWYVNDGNYAVRPTLYYNLSSSNQLSYAGTAASDGSGTKVAYGTTYSVAFNSNGGSDIATQTVPANTTAQRPEDPIKTGYTFGGWYSDAALTTEWGFNAAVKANTTLYAKWSLGKYIITYILNGATNPAQNPKNYTYGTAQSLYSPTYTGYTFGGWYTSADFSGTALTQIPAGTAGNITLYAKWAKNSTDNIEPKDSTAPAPKAKGTVIRLSSTKMKYKVTSSDSKNPTLAYAGTTDKKKTTIAVPSSVTYQGVTYKVTSIADKALKGNKKITSVKLGNNITKIGTSAFEGCTALNTVSIGTGLKTIGTKAFYGDKKLKKITIKSKKLTSVGKYSFKNIYKKAVIKVPSTKLKTYKAKTFKKAGLAKTVTFGKV